MSMRAGRPTAQCSLDLGRSSVTVGIGKDAWSWAGHDYPYLEQCRERTVYYWAGQSFEPVARFAGSLVKLVPTEWGPPTFEIDGIKMLPTAQVSPYADAEAKVALIQPRGKADLPQNDAMPDRHVVTHDQCPPTRAKGAVVRYMQH